MEEKSIFSKLKEILQVIFGGIVVIGFLALFIYGIFTGGQNIFNWIKYNTGDSLLESKYIDEVSPDFYVLNFKQIEGKWGPLDEEYRKSDVEYGSNEINDIWEELAENPGDCSEWMVNTYITFSHLLYDIDRLYEFDESSRENGFLYYVAAIGAYPNEENIKSHIYLNLALLTFFSEIEIQYISIVNADTIINKIYTPSLSHTEGYIKEMILNLKPCPEDKLIIELPNEEGGIYTSYLYDMIRNFADLDREGRMLMHEIFTIPVFYNINDLSQQYKE
tara:strand:+ start:104 stop:934 length:831 start_codon:yes stop_codon:yes gene_type:complete